LLQASFFPCVVGVSAVLGVLLLSMLLAVANTTALLVLLRVFLLYSTERLQQQGLKKITGKEEWGRLYAPRIGDTESRQLPASVRRGVGNSSYR
jgi:uncharacterized membrane protein YdfJ with MMPL/SSD domain